MAHVFVSFCHQCVHSKHETCWTGSEGAGVSGTGCDVGGSSPRCYSHCAQLDDRFSTLHDEKTWEQFSEGTK